MTRKTSDNEMNEIRVELKYCERCGGIWLRRCGNQLVYCADCVPKVAQLPPPSRPMQLGKGRSRSDFALDKHELDNQDIEGQGFDIHAAQSGLSVDAAGGVA